MAEIVGTKLGIWFYKKGKINIDQVDYIRFGFETICSELLVIIIIVCYGIFNDSYIQSIVYILLFWSLRKNMQGYHAKTIWKCFIITVGAYLFTMNLYQFIDLKEGILLFILSAAIQTKYIIEGNDNRLVKIQAFLFVIFMVFACFKVYSLLQLFCLINTIVSLSWVFGKEESHDKVIS